MSKTYGEQFKEALACTTKAEAQAWMEAEIVRYEREFGQTAEEARRVIMVNIGYMTGYYGPEVGEKIHDLFGAVHPIFGRSQPTAEEAFKAGVAAADGDSKSEGT